MLYYISALRLWLVFIHKQPPAPRRFFTLGQKEEDGKWSKSYCNYRDGRCLHRWESYEVGGEVFKSFTSKSLHSESYLSRYILTLRYQQTVQGSWSSRKWEYVHGGLRQSAHSVGGATGSYRDKAFLLLLFTISMRFACVSIPFKDVGNRTMITHNTLLHMSSAS